MTWIKGIEQQTITFRAPIEKTYAFFVSPAQRSKAYSDIERREVVDAQTERWILVTKKEMGVELQPDYTTRYEGNGKDQVTWKPAAEGTTKTSGIARMKALGPDTTEVYYEESVESNLPIPSLMAKVFRPIVAREIRKGVKDFLKNSQSLLEGA